eukprot:130333-Ditylum_brightwellii.AAC.1
MEIFLSAEVNQSIPENTSIEPTLETFAEFLHNAPPHTRSTLGTLVDQQVDKKYWINAMQS